VCYCDDMEVDSPLINPCNCLGGVKYIHFSCLQHWLKTKSSLRGYSNKYCITYTFNKIECEICKTTFPDLIKYGSDTFQLWDFIDHKFKNYIILETVMTERSTKRTFFILNFDEKNEIKLGRNIDSDLRISDISVSRTHAFFRKRNNLYSIEDNNSKFGTLCQLQHPLFPLIEQNYISFQIGKSILTFSLEKPSTIWSRLFYCKKKVIETVNYSYLNSKFIPFDHILLVKIMDDFEESQDDSINLEENLIVEKDERFNNLNYCEPCESL
jgi:hypothetical protein